MRQCCQSGDRAPATHRSRCWIGDLVDCGRPGLARRTRASRSASSGLPSQPPLGPATSAESARARCDLDEKRGAASRSTLRRIMKETTVTLTGVIDTFLVLLIGIGPKIALVPFLQITAPLPAEVRVGCVARCS
jgi:hypothetical protein